jgi:hypothetical protein
MSLILQALQENGNVDKSPYRHSSNIIPCGGLLKPTNVSKSSFKAAGPSTLVLAVCFKGIPMAKSMTFTEPYLNKAANEIDAAMFSGDAFLDETNRTVMREWLSRWERGLARAEELAVEVAQDEDDNDDD